MGSKPGQDGEFELPIHRGKLTCNRGIVHVTPLSNVHVKVVVNGLETVRDGVSSRGMVAEVWPVVQASQHVVGVILGGRERAVQDTGHHVSGM